MTVEEKAGKFAHDFEIECAMFVGVHPKTVAFQSYYRGYNDGVAATPKADDVIAWTCSKNGVRRYGESCNLNNNCQWPKCLKPNEPKAAAPKADEVKSKEVKPAYEILQDHVDPHCFLKAKCYEAAVDAMEEYANQFKPQGKTFTLQDMLDYGKWMRDQLFKYEDGVPEMDYLKEKHGIDLNIIQ